MRPAWLSRRIGLLICAHLVSILSEEVVRQERERKKKKPSCLVKSLLSGNRQKSIFNSAVCVRAPPSTPDVIILLANRVLAAQINT